MSLIVEDGTGLATAESFVSVVNADTYHSNRGNATWATLTTEQKEQALRRATDYMEQVYRTRWTGYLKTTTQALGWPRTEAPLADVGYGYAYYSSDAVPQIVKNACAELALKAAAGELAPDVEPRVKREKVGPIETEYAEYGEQSTQFRAIDNMLLPVLSSVGGAFRKVVRS
jgi:hypothetical protein